MVNKFVDGIQNLLKHQKKENKEMSMDEKIAMTEKTFDSFDAGLYAISADSLLREGKAKTFEEALIMAKNKNIESAKKDLKAIKDLSDQERELMEAMANINDDR